MKDVFSFYTRSLDTLPIHFQGLKRLALTVILITFIFPFLRVPTVYGQEPLKVLVLPFALYSEEDISGLGRELLKRLAENISEASEIEILDGERIERILRERGIEAFTEEESYLIGKEEGAEFVVTGSISKIGKRISMDARILNIPDQRLAALAYIEAGDTQRLLGRIPSLGDGIKMAILREALTLGRVFVKKEIISKIQIVGNRRIESEAILARIKSRVGEPFSKEMIDEDLKAIYDMGYFHDVLVDIADTAVGKEVTFIVKERPTIREVSISGHKEVKKEKIEEVIEVKPNTILNRTTLKNDVERIKALYRSKGFYLAEVGYRIDPVEEGFVNVTFTIKEGSKVKVGRISFIGNTVFTDKELKKAMRTKEWSVLSLVTERGVYDDFLLENDINTLLGKYYDEGYVRAEIGPPQVEVSEDKKWIYITIPIKEGEQYRVGEVDLSGDLIKPKIELMEMVETKPGEIYSRSTLSKDVSRLAGAYGDEGYAFVDIRPVTKIDDRKKKVDITFDITKGEKVYIERIEITGNTKTRDKVIRRELEVYEGELYSATGIKRSKRNLNRLGYFDEVNIVSLPGSAPDRMVLRVEVKERPTGAIAAGAGYSSVDHFIVSTSISQNNLFGTGRKVKIEATLSSSTKRYDISFTEPWLFDYPISAGFDLFRLDREYPDFTRFSNGGDVRFGFKVHEDTRLFLTYKLEEVEVKDVASGASLLIKEQEGRRVESTITTSITRDTRNSLFDPTEGSMIDLSVEFAGGPLGGDNNFAKYVFTGDRYFPMPKDTTFRIRTILGYIHSFGGKKIPIYERFFLGGINTLRGFKTRSIGPKDEATGEVIGGDKEVVLNLEYIFPLFKEQRVKGLVFFDAGNAYDVGEFDLGDIRTSAGFGIRWLSPLGPIRLEWGYVLNRKKDEESSQFEFSVGATF